MKEHSHCLNIIHNPVAVQLRKRVERCAVRAVIHQGKNFLMVYSEQIGDYKFPGGGIEYGEDAASALSRELQEECGCITTEIGPKLLVIEEFSQARESSDTAFVMKSAYYSCSISSRTVQPELEKYEQELGFVSRWVSLEEALTANNAILNDPTTESPSWLQREILALETMSRLFA
ncbi:NUDIX hydrolase [Spirochaeta dissipatitropha]